MDGSDLRGDSGRRRVFVLTAGRSGSTLLASILADAGGDFGMPIPERWDPGTGALEHDDLRRAALWMRLAHQISVDRPPIGYRRIRWTIFRSLGKSRAKRALRRARFLKCVDADLLVNPAFRMGFLPTIVVSYRRFEDFVASAALMRNHTTLETLAANYTRSNRNALLWLSIFGGCVVNQQQLTDPDDTSWVEPLATVTNLPPARLLEARIRRFGKRVPIAQTPCLDQGAQQIFEAIDARRGMIIPPSAQALRSWTQKQPVVPAAGGQGATTRPRWRWLARPSIELSALAMAFVDRRVPWYARAVLLGCLVAYALAPVDPIGIKRELRSAAATWLGTIL